MKKMKKLPHVSEQLPGVFGSFSARRSHGSSEVAGTQRENKKMEAQNHEAQREEDAIRKQILEKDAENESLRLVITESAEKTEKVRNIGLDLENLKSAPEIQRSKEAEPSKGDRRWLTPTQDEKI